MATLRTYSTDMVQFLAIKRFRFRSLHSLLPGLRRHQAVQLRVPRELVGKRHKGSAYLYQSIPGVNIRDVGKLQFRNIKKPGKLYPVGSCLIQHHDKFAVREHCAGRMALQQIIHVLRNARTKSAVLSDALPKREQKVGAVFMLKQKIDFVNNDKCIFAFNPVLCNPIQDAVQDNQHADREELFAQVENIVADEPVMDIDIGRLSA